MLLKDQAPDKRVLRARVAPVAVTDAKFSEPALPDSRRDLFMRTSEARRGRPLVNAHGRWIDLTLQRLELAVGHRVERWQQIRIAAVADLGVKRRPVAGAIPAAVCRAVVSSVQLDAALWAVRVERALIGVVDNGAGLTGRRCAFRTGGLRKKQSHDGLKV